MTTARASSRPSSGSSCTSARWAASIMSEQAELRLLVRFAQDEGVVCVGRAHAGAAG